MAKITNERYVLMTEISDGVVYFTEDNGFSLDIHDALMAKNKITAQFIRNNLEIKHKFHLDIVPVKITYEW
jgi:hypothetical protein